MPEKKKAYFLRINNNNKNKEKEEMEKRKEVGKKGEKKEGNGGIREVGTSTLMILVNIDRKTFGRSVQVTCSRY